MSEFDLILSGGRVLSSVFDGVADRALKDGRIQALGKVSGAAAHEIDCRGKIAARGGVDVNSHFEQMSGMDLMNADTFESATLPIAMTRPGSCRRGMAQPSRRWRTGCRSWKFECR